MPYLIWKSFDWDRGGLAVFEAIKRENGVFFLDASLNDETRGRYSFLGFDPFFVLEANGSSEAFSRIREVLRCYSLNGRKYDFPFLCGAVGYFSYDLGAKLMRIGNIEKDNLGLPDVSLGLYDTIIAIDHLKNKLVIFSSGFPEKKYLSAKKRAERRLKQFQALLSGIKCKNAPPETPLKSPGLGIVSNFTKEKYLDSIRITKDYIRKGDIYQVNLSQRFCAKADMDAPRLYRRLRRTSPSSFSAYFDCGDFQILSSSPERFLYFDGKKVITRPMKGTRPRGKSAKEDSSLKRELLESAKDKAELIMIVDLLRNDLGRVCEYGSVKVSSMRDLEKYSTVYQTTATIEGRLHSSCDRVDLIKACFPGGSVTGCPKIRSMQIINELEPSPRNVYTGSLGYLSFNNTMDLNILIRTMLKKDDKVYFQAGGGIVADSDPEKEYNETLIKARGCFEAIGR